MRDLLNYSAIIRGGWGESETQNHLTLPSPKVEGLLLLPWEKAGMRDLIIIVQTSAEAGGIFAHGVSPPFHSGDAIANAGAKIVKA